MKTIAVYIRLQERGEPDLPAPDDQEREIRRYCTERYGEGKYKMELFRELAPFNRIDGRPELHRMLERMGAHRTDVIAVDRLACLFRTMEDGVIIGDYLKAHNTALVSVTEGDIDLNSIEKRLLGNVDRLIARHYADRKKKK